MNKFAKFLAAAVMVCSFSAQAQWLVKGALAFDMLTNSTSKPAADEKSEDVKFLTFTGGYIFQNTYYVGAVYDMKTKEVDDDGVINSADLKHMGLSAGYILNNWMFALNYYLSATNDVKVNNTPSTLEDGTGFGLDISYGLELMPGLKGGLQIVYRALEYTKGKSGGVTFDSDLKVTETAPTVFLAWSI